MPGLFPVYFRPFSKVNTMLQKSKYDKLAIQYAAVGYKIITPRTQVSFHDH